MKHPIAKPSDRCPKTSFNDGTLSRREKGIEFGSEECRLDGSCGIPKIETILIHRILFNIPAKTTQ
jgi:hypothetical protein